MDLDTLREWLIQNGINENELDDVNPPQALNDLADMLVLSLDNTNQLAEFITSLLAEIDNLRQRVEVLENA